MTSLKEIQNQCYIATYAQNRLLSFYLVKIDNSIKILSIKYLIMQFCNYEHDTIGIFLIFCHILTWQENVVLKLQKGKSLL